MFKNQETRVRKSDLTKQKLYQVALDLIAKEGFDETTMRAIAAKAGVAPGAIYYHFASKESLIQEYYKQSHIEHIKAIEEFFAREKNFGKRLHKLVTSRIELAVPYKDMARALFRTAADPMSELSPFSEESKTIRLESLRLYEAAVEGSDEKFLPEIRKILPKYLWLYQMGIILFWIYDSSASSKRTFEFIDKTVPLIESLNQTISSAWAAPFRKKLISILQSFTPDLGGDQGLSS